MPHRLRPRAADGREHTLYGPGARGTPAPGRRSAPAPRPGRRTSSTAPPGLTGTGRGPPGHRDQGMTLRQAPAKLAGICPPATPARHSAAPSTDAPTRRPAFARLRRSAGVPGRRPPVAGACCGRASGDRRGRSTDSAPPRPTTANCTTTRGGLNVTAGTAARPGTAGPSPPGTRDRPCTTAHPDSTTSDTRPSNNKRRIPLSTASTTIRPPPTTTRSPGQTHPFTSPGRLPCVNVFSTRPSLRGDEPYCKAPN